MTLDEIEQLLIKEGFKKANKIITDANYARPTTDYLLGKFYEFYRAWMSEHSLGVWTAKYDCDNFASTFYTFAQICHFKSKRPEQGIAVGELYYFIDGGGGHVVNMAITEKGLIIIEPQTGKEVELTETEKENAMLIHF
jgi:hypothetical protein